jgi:hypothetical protein
MHFGRFSPPVSLVPFFSAAPNFFKPLQQLAKAEAEGEALQLRLNNLEAALANLSKEEDVLGDPVALSEAIKAARKDPEARLRLKAEIQKRVQRIDLDFTAKIPVAKVTFVNGRVMRFATKWVAKPVQKMLG